MLTGTYVVPLLNNYIDFFFYSSIYCLVENISCLTALIAFVIMEAIELFVLSDDEA